VINRHPLGTLVFVPNRFQCHISSSDLLHVARSESTAATSSATARRESFVVPDETKNLVTKQVLPFNMNAKQKHRENQGR
jgi:hypothetical protein